MAIRKLPLGTENFEEVRKSNLYYVDKTGLISDLLRRWSEVTLFTRPRRFGKTLNMSMLKSFFEIGCDKSLFDGLAIAREKELCEQYMGQFPVISISLKDVDGLSFELAYEKLRKVIISEITRHRYLAESDRISEYDKKPLERILNEADRKADICFSLKMLCRLLEKHYGKKPIVLIDEYDMPLDRAYSQGYYNEMLEIIHSMLYCVLKGNDSLFFALMTGCMRISKESIFTGLNNLKICSVSDVEYDEYFGFTDDEVRKILSDYGFESHYDEVREWYDGYLFGKQSVYCPWDVISYCDTLLHDPEAEPQAYWLNTSDNDMVRRLVDRTQTGSVQPDIEDLIAGQTVVKSLNEQITHSEIDSSIDNIWSLLYMTGYLTVTQRPSNESYILRIPNKEIRKIFEKQVMAWFTDKANAESDKLSDLYTAFETGNTDAIAGILNDKLLDTVSFYDAYESFYHGFLLALLSTCKSWLVTSNRETGKGRSDIIVERRDRKLGFVIEVKEVKTEEKLDAAVANAMRQIEENDYTAALRRRKIKEIRQYAIAFWDKECKIEAKRVAL